MGFSLLIYTRYHGYTAVWDGYALGWLCAFSVNCITLQAWMFHNFAILSILGRQQDMPTALLRCMEWACQIVR